MKTIHLDTVGGIAGDMFVAAMIDTFPELQERVFNDIQAVLPPEAGQPSIIEAMSGAVCAKLFGLQTPYLAAPVEPKHGHSHGDGEAHPIDHHHHHHDPSQGSFRDMVRRIENARLATGTASHAVAILTVLAEAEARIHSVAVEDVHFHEIADWDSLMDVVAAGSIAAALAGTQWTVSALPRGGGLIKTQHGLLPVPAPATAAILEGFEWRDDGISGERVTPTGAAILKHLVGMETGAAQEGRLLRSGTGAGTRELQDMPNILRVLAFEQATPHAADTVTVISFEIDDMTGEEIGIAADRLRTVDGVLDVSLGERWGKKGRPTQSFSLLVRPGCVEVVAARCFCETSTIGLRTHDVKRRVLDRSLMKQDGIGVKKAERPGGATLKVESDHLTDDTLAKRRAVKQRVESGEHG